MVREILWVSVGLLAGGTTFNSSGALVSLWSFDSSSATTPITADSGIGSQPGATLAFAGNTRFDNAGTTLNDPRTSPSATFRMEYQASSGKEFILQLTGANLSGFQVSYAGEIVSGGTLSTVTWSWSTTTAADTGLAGHTLTTQPGDLTTSWAVQTADFRGVTQLDGATTIFLKATFSDKDAFDNIQITATPVPEPVNVALALFGVGFVAWKGLRRRAAEEDRR